MFNYKRLTFIFLILSFLLVVSDTSMEKQAKRSLLSFVNIVVEEGTEVGENAPGTFLDSLEAGRLNTYNFLENQARVIQLKEERSTGFMSYLYSFILFLIGLFRFVCSYVITFYPIIIFLLYIFFTSAFFRRNEYGSGFNNY